jgi:hypothetical protein
MVALPPNQPAPAGAPVPVPPCNSSMTFTSMILRPKWLTSFGVQDIAHRRMRRDEP